MQRPDLRKWLIIGIHIKRWLVVLAGGIVIVAGAVGMGALKLASDRIIVIDPRGFSWLSILAIFLIGLGVMVIAMMRISHKDRKSVV